MPDVSKNLLYELELFCNNFFNPQNDPDDPQRDYPPAFLELADKIEKFIKTVERNNTTSSRVGTGAETYDIEAAAWQKTFGRDLSIWKRARFI